MFSQASASIPWHIHPHQGAVTVGLYSSYSFIVAIFFVYFLQRLLRFKLMRGSGGFTHSQMLQLPEELRRWAGP